MKTLILTSSMALVSGLMVYPVQAQDAGVKNLMTSSFQSIGIAGDVYEGRHRVLEPTLR